MTEFNGYCVKCREKRDFSGQEVEMANGRRAAQGPCPVCGTKINRMLGAKRTDASRIEQGRDQEQCPQRRRATSWLCPILILGGTTRCVARRPSSRASAP